MNLLGWQGKKVRHVDGRTGIIAQELGRDYCELGILCDDETVGRVVLCAYGDDFGDTGWQWWCPEFDHGPAWLPLGSNGGPLECDPPKEVQS